jgi:uncharacterized protein GlcG (DUF336 family)
MASSGKNKAALSYLPNLTLDAAAIGIEACQAKARSIGVPMNISIVDATLYPLAFARMPGAKLTSIDIAQNKAFTAAGHKLGTHMYKENVWPGGIAYGIDKSNGGRFSVIGGGLPIQVDGQVIGAIGCSTGTPAQDQEVSQAGVEAVLQYVKQTSSDRIKAKL